MAEAKYKGGGLSLKVYKDQEWSKVETTSSSEGDGGSAPDTPSGGESNIEYLDITNVSDEQRLLLSTYAQAVKAESEDGIKGVGLPLSAMQSSIGYSLQLNAIAIEESATIKVFIQGQELVTTLRDLLLSQGSNLTTFPRITKEEFYSLD